MDRRQDIQLAIGKKIGDVKEDMPLFELLSHSVSERVDDEDFFPLQFFSPGLRVPQGNKSVEINQGALSGKPRDEKFLEVPETALSSLTSYSHDIRFLKLLERFLGESG